MTEIFPDPAPVEPLAAVPVLGRPALSLSTWRLAIGVTVALTALLAIAAVALAWKAGQRVASFEQELVRRQQESAGQAGEARLIAKEAQDSVRDTSAKVALLEARVAEVAVQRTQLEELIQSLSRTRAENLLGDIESTIRIAAQQSLVTGSAEPLVAALKQSDERLSRNTEPRLDAVRRAIARDIDRLKATSVSDIPALGIKLDETIRLVDDLPLLAGPDGRRGPASTEPTAAAAASSGATQGLAGLASWSGKADEWWGLASGRVGSELRSLVRVTRIDHPEAMLLAPEQGFFLRENLKLRLLNARLALTSRQFDSAQTDLATARGLIDRYFDRSSRRTQAAVETIRQIAVQSRQAGVPRPDETLSALGAAAGLR